MADRKSTWRTKRRKFSAACSKSSSVAGPIHLPSDAARQYWTRLFHFTQMDVTKASTCYHWREDKVVIKLQCISASTGSTYADGRFAHQLPGVLAARYSGRAFDRTYVVIPLLEDLVGLSSSATWRGPSFSVSMWWWWCFLDRLLAGKGQKGNGANWHESDKETFCANQRKCWSAPTRIVGILVLPFLSWCSLFCWHHP